MADWVNLSHSREHIAGIITSKKVSDDVVEKVHHQFKLGRTGPLDTVLDVIRDESLLDATPKTLAHYAVSHWADPALSTAPDPAFLLALDDRTAEDSSVLFVSQFPHKGDVATIRIEAHVTINLRSVVMIKNPDAIEEYNEELAADETDVYTDDSAQTEEEALQYNYAVVLVPREHLRIEGDQFVLAKEKSSSLGMGEKEWRRFTTAWEKVDREDCFGFQGSYQELVDAGTKGLRVLTHMDYAL